MVKLSSALQQGVLTLFLLISGLFSITKQFEELLNSKVTDTKPFNDLLSTVTSDQIFIYSIGMCFIPVILFIIQYILIKNKYIIDEDFYEKMILEIDERKQNKIEN